MDSDITSFIHSGEFLFDPRYDERFNPGDDGPSGYECGLL